MEKIDKLTMIDELEDLLYLRLSKRVEREMNKRPNVSIIQIRNLQWKRMKTEYENIFKTIDNLKSELNINY